VCSLLEVLPNRWADVHLHACKRAADFVGVATSAAPTTPSQLPPAARRLMPPLQAGCPAGALPLRRPRPRPAGGPAGRRQPGAGGGVGPLHPNHAGPGGAHPGGAAGAGIRIPGGGRMACHAFGRRARGARGAGGGVDFRHPACSDVARTRACVHALRGRRTAHVPC
jgi:hypothetical protein